MKKISSFSKARIAALVIWLFGAAMNWKLIDELTIQPWYLSALYALLAQLVFTTVERPIWHKNSYHPVNVAVLVLDALTVAAGIWAGMKNVPESSLGQFVGQAFEVGSPSFFILGLMSLGIGLVVAAIPELITMQDD